MNAPYTPADAPLQTSATGSAAIQDRIDFTQWLAAIRRHQLLASLIAGLLFAGAIALITRIPSVYSSQATLFIDTNRAPLGDFRANVPQTSPDDESVRSVVQVIGSYHIAEQVVDQLHLAANPRFNGTQSGPMSQIIGTVKAALGRFIGMPPAPAGPSGPEAARDHARAAATAAVLHALNVSTDGRSYIVTIGFSDRDPALAAQIANAVAGIYLQDQVAYKKQMAIEVDDWLDQQIAGLRAAVNRSDEAVEDYRARHNLTRARGGTVVSQQLTELDSELVAASADRAEKQAYLDEIRRLQASGGQGAEGAMLASPLLQRLREQEAQIAANETALKEQFGPHYPALRRVEAEHRQILAKIGEAVRTLSTTAATDAAAASAKENALRARVNALEGATAKDDQSAIKLHELERDAEANQALLQNMLDQAKLVEAQKNFVLPDARLVSPAPLPMRPSFPQHGVLLLVSAFLAATAGCGTAIIVDRRRSGFRTEDELEAASGLFTLGLIPRMPDAKRRPLEVIYGSDLGAEPFNFVRSLLPTAGPNHRSGSLPQVILVTSAVPGEGKTFFATSFALSLAAANQRCLLLDCDLRKPSVAAALEVERRSNRFEPISSPLAPVGPTLRDTETGLYFVSARRSMRSAARVLESGAFTRYIETARNYFDVIVMDAPPVFPIADALHLSMLADGTVFVVSWEKTPQRVVTSALSTLRAAGGSLLGTVLTNIDVRGRALYGRADRAAYYERYRRAYGA